MAKFLVEKSGPLSGEIEISGSKNAVLPIMAAAILTGESCQIPTNIAMIKGSIIIPGILAGLLSMIASIMVCKLYERKRI